MPKNEHLAPVAALLRSCSYISQSRLLHLFTFLSDSILPSKKSTREIQALNIVQFNTMVVVNVTYHNFANS